MSAADPIAVDFYVYYRVHHADLEEAFERVHAMLADLEMQTGIRGRLMRRRDDDTTLMEVYPGVIDLETFERLLEEALDTHRIGELLAEGSGRHLERFICA
ncbi:MAG TPA: DUF4936 family protein [Azoarcus sp.]|nr:DUF4936 family protein [Azoarcus sp.]